MNWYGSSHRQIWMITMENMNDNYGKKRMITMEKWMITMEKWMITMKKWMITMHSTTFN